jgi:hypothetical protein
MQLGEGAGPKNYPASCKYSKVVQHVRVGNTRRIQSSKKRNLANFVVIKETAKLTLLIFKQGLVHLHILLSRYVKSMSCSQDDDYDDWEAAEDAGVSRQDPMTYSN